MCAPPLVVPALTPLLPLHAHALLALLCAACALLAGSVAAVWAGSGAAVVRAFAFAAAVVYEAAVLAVCLPLYLFLFFTHTAPSVLPTDVLVCVMGAVPVCVFALPATALPSPSPRLSLHCNTVWHVALYFGTVPYVVGVVVFFAPAPLVSPPLAIGGLLLALAFALLFVAAVALVLRSIPKSRPRQRDHALASLVVAVSVVHTGGVGLPLFVCARASLSAASCQLLAVCVLLTPLLANVVGVVVVAQSIGVEGDEGEGECFVVAACLRQLVVLLLPLALALPLLVSVLPHGVWSVGTATIAGLLCLPVVGVVIVLWLWFRWACGWQRVLDDDGDADDDDDTASNNFSQLLDYLVDQLSRPAPTEVPTLPAPSPATLKPPEEGWRSVSELSMGHFECPICFQVMRHPVSTSPCGHDFCRECLEQWLARKRSCPLCSGAVASFQPNGVLQTTIGAFTDP